MMNNTKILIKNIVALSLCLISVSVSAHINLVELRDASIKDAARILAKMAKANISVTSEVADLRIDLTLRDVSLKHAVEMLSRISGAWYRYDKVNNSYLVMTENQYQDSIVVYRDDIIRPFTLKHQNVKATALTIQSLFGDRVILNLQNELDDFEGIPDDYLKSHIESSGESGSRVTITNTSNNKTSSGTKRDSIEVIGQGETVKDFFSEEGVLGDKISTAKLRALGSALKIDADKQGSKIGLKTPIFITVNRIHNLMFVRTSDESAMSDIEQLIKVSDKPTPQVLLEMKIVKIGDSEGFEQEFDLSFNDSYNVNGASYKDESLRADVLSDNALLEFESGLGIGGVTQVLSQIAGNSVSKFGLNATQGGFYEFYSKYINAKVEFLEKNNVAEAVAKPILLASNNRPARLFIGEDQVIATGIDAGSINQVDNGNTTSTTATETSLNTEVKKIGSTLALLPSVNDDLTVTIDIFQSTSSLKRNGMSFPFFNTQTGEIDSVLLDTVEESTLKTIVVARDGYTVALGGMINESKLNEYTTVPILGDIPFLGELFKTKSEHESSGQYLMLITPHIIVNPEEGMNKTREISDINFDKYADVELGETAETKGEALQIPDFISLARYAGNDFFGYEQTSNLKPKPLINTLSVESKSHTNLLEEGLSVTPLKSYQQGGLYVTVAGVKNTSNEKQYLEVKDARGNWLAVASESRYLLSKNDQNTKGSDYGYLYFISDKSFSESLPIGE